MLNTHLVGQARWLVMPLHYSSARSASSASPSLYSPGSTLARWLQHIGSPQPLSTAHTRTEQAPGPGRGLGTRLCKPRGTYPKCQQGQGGGTVTSPASHSRALSAR